MKLFDDLDVVSSKQFTVCKTNTKKVILVIEDSTFRHLAQSKLLYDDACDEGFKIRSDRTGHEEIFALSRLVTDEGELTAIIYTSITNPLWEAHVIND
jgi:hypothetical protein